MKKQILIVFFTLAILTVLSGCGNRPEQDPSAAPAVETTTTAGAATVAETTMVAEATTAAEATTTAEEPSAVEEKEKMLKMMIGDTAVAVDWENNESVEALKSLCSETPLVIQMSMYGGFEQVGSIGTRLPASDVQTRTSAGDIVLYSSDQIVVFYGSNSWSYTRLGHITDQDASGMAELLGNEDVTITISMEDAE